MIFSALLQSEKLGCSHTPPGPHCLVTKLDENLHGKLAMYPISVAGQE